MSQSQANLKHTVSLRDVNFANWRDCYALDSGDGVKFVASNAYSMLEAIYDPTQTMRGIYADETPVGFILFGSPMIPDDFELPEEAQYLRDILDNPTQHIIVMRLMVDKQHQRKGYGRQAMQQLIDAIRLIGHHKSIFISFVPENIGAQTLYELLGFKDTGLMMFGEKVYRLNLKGDA